MGTTDQSIATASDPQGERERSRRLAERYRCAFVDLFEQRIDPELFRSIPAELMFRFNFVPMEAQNGALVIAVADPSQVLLSDELPLLLGKKLILKVATPTQISDLLKRTEQSQRVLDQATEAFTLTVVEEDEDSEANISADTLTSADSAVSPVVRLVDTVIFTALERRASDIHIEARDIEVAVKYRIDGVLVHAMAPISKDWLSTIISRIKVMSELDIAERRVPQDGRFRVKYKGDRKSTRLNSSHRPSAACRRTGVSGSSTKDALSIFVFPSCRPSMGRTQFSASWTRKRSRRSFRTSAWTLSAFRTTKSGNFAGTSANPMEWCL